MCETNCRAIKSIVMGCNVSLKYEKFVSGLLVMLVRRPVDEADRNWDWRWDWVTVVCNSFLVDY